VVVAVVLMRALLVKTAVQVVVEQVTHLAELVQEYQDRATQVVTEQEHHHQAVVVVLAQLAVTQLEILEQVMAERVA
jgi:hypothetical protein